MIKNLSKNLNNFIVNPKINLISSKPRNVISKNSSNYPTTTAFIAKTEKNKGKNDDGKLIISLEDKIERITQKLNNLENKIDRDEKKTLNTEGQLNEMKSNINNNFNKLGVLEKLVTKMK